MNETLNELRSLSSRSDPTGAHTKLNELRERINRLNTYYNSRPKPEPEPKQTSSAWDAAILTTLIAMAAFITIVVIL